MTYLVFLLVFIVPLVGVGAWHSLRSRDPQQAKFLTGIAILCFLALLYTTPWDNFLVKTGVWKYFDERVLGRWGYVPIEEYAFFVLQTFLTGFWTYFVYQKIGIVIWTRESEIESPAPRNWGLVFWILVTGIGTWCSFYESGRYMALILLWATPVAFLQWALGGVSLWANRKLYLFALIPPTLYLWAVDSFAISQKTWMISESQTLGLQLGVLPIEEAVFFLMTNIMLVQGLMLFVSLQTRFPKVYQKLGLEVTK